MSPAAAKPMRIAIEATAIQRPMLTGFGHYVLNLIKALGRVAPQNEYLLLHAAEEWNGMDFGPQFRPVSYFCRKTPVGVLMNLNVALRRERAELFHATCTTGVPPDPPVPCVATMHDVYPVLFPHEVYSPPTSLYRMLLKLSLDNSRHFICNSDFTAAELSAEYGIDSARMTTAHLAPAQDERLLSWPLGRPESSYILCAGAIERRKGQLMLLEAYRRVVEKWNDAPPLLFIGPDRGDGEQLVRMIAAFELGRKVDWFRYVSNRALAGYYRSASHFVFPSTYEGFGIPVIEAMAAGIPTLCTDIPVFREIAGDYPIYAKPEPRAFAAALEELVKGRHKEHFKTAPRRRYSWDENARITLDCYAKAF
jgi:glycosyltransferase involved in cell wall biosynthesis